MPQPKVDRSILNGEAVEMFRAGIKSDHTRDPYERRLLQFLNYVGMTPDKLVSTAKKNPSQIEKKILSFILLQKRRVTNKEITGSTVSNFLKAIRLLLEMNDATAFNWKKIRRFLPSSRRYALDRIPTIEEVREILEAADTRGKALTLLFLTSGVREGTIEYFQIRDYSIIERDGKTVAGRLVVYRGEPEEHVVFCDPATVAALDRYIQHRREHGENIRPDSPLFRDKFDPLKEKDIHNSTEDLSLRSNCLDRIHIYTVTIHKLYDFLPTFCAIRPFEDAIKVMENQSKYGYIGNR